MFRLRLWRDACTDASRALLRPALRVVWFPFASAAKTAYVLWTLTCRLAHLLGASPRWMALLVRLLVFSCLISPALLQLVPYYVGSSSIRRGIRYGPHRRNDFDVHLPPPSVRFGPQPAGSPPLRPVVVLFAGGAWMIGYKLWTLALCRTLAALGIIAVAADYRNYPQCTTSGMVEDVSAAIDAAFALPEIAAAGGDPRLVYVWGQSAGAHLAACAVVERAVCETLEARAAADASAAAASASASSSVSAQPPRALGGGCRASSSVSLVRLVHSGVDASAEFDDYAVPLADADAEEGGGTEVGRETPQSSAGGGGSEAPRDSTAAPGAERAGVSRWGGDGGAGRMRMGGRWLFQRRDSDGGDGRGGPQAAAVFDARRATACSPPLLCSPPREGGRDVSGAAAAAGDALPWGLAAEAAAEEGDASAPEGGRILRRRVLDFPAAGGHGAAALTYEEVLVLQAPRENSRAARTRFFGVSGACDIGAIAPSFQAKAGVPESFISAMFEGSLERYSPALWFRACAGGGGGGGGGSAYPPLDASRMPAVSLFHGGSDLCVPPSSSLAFAAVLAEAGVPATATVFMGKSHTDPVVEDPLGGAEPLLEAMLQLIWDDMCGALGPAAVPPPAAGAAAAQTSALLLHGAVVAAAGALVPGPMLSLARWVNPFS